MLIVPGRTTFLSFFFCVCFAKVFLLPKSAVTQNGLAWVKDTVGSDSEDLEGVSLGLNTESWWGFDTAHVVGNHYCPVLIP